MFTRLDREEQIKYLSLLGFALLSIAIGFYFSSFQDIVQGIGKLIVHHSLVDTDAFGVGGVGAAFVNSALCSIILLFMYLLTNTRIGSGEIAAFFMVFGYAFYGKEIFNMLPLAAGVYLYTFIKGKPLYTASSLAGFATALGPIVSVLVFNSKVLGATSPISIAVGVFFGIAAGFTVALLAGHMGLLIRGRSMLLAGFTTGVTGVFFFALLKALGLGHVNDPNSPIVDPSYRTPILIAMVILFLYLLVLALIRRAGFSDLMEIMRSVRPEKDYVDKHGFDLALMSSGTMGLLGVLYFILVPNTQMHGEIWAGVYTIVAFTSKGMVPRYMIAFVLGMGLASFSTGGIANLITGNGGFFSGAMAKLASRPVLMGTYIGCGMAPLAEVYGSKKAFILGLIFAIVTPSIAPLHGWLNLYNSGFSLGLVIVLFATNTLED